MVVLLLLAFEDIIFFYFTMAKQMKQILEELGEKLKTFGSNGQVKEDCVSGGGKRFSVSLWILIICFSSQITANDIGLQYGLSLSEAYR